MFPTLELMKTHQIRRLPVVNEKHEVMGLLSLGDAVRKAGIEARLQKSCKASASPHTHLSSELKESLQRLDYRFYDEVRGGSPVAARYPLITATGSSLATFRPIPSL